MESTSLLAEMPPTTASPATPTTTPRPPPSPPPIESPSEDANKKVESNQNPSPLADYGTSKEEDSNSASERAAQDNIKTNHNHESSIKLKRCKHGRIIIKDPSKKKSGQYSDNDANNTSKYKNGLHHNNNNIISETSGRDHKNGVDIQSKTSEEQLAPSIDEQKDAKSNHKSKGPVQSQPLTPPTDQNQPEARNDESVDKISSTNGIDKYDVTVDAAVRSRSSSLSLSPVRDANKIRSPPRRTRNGRSRSKKERSVSRDRSRGDSHRRMDSPSPRRRSRTRSPKRQNRKSSRRSHKSSGRHRDSDSRRRSRSKSSSRHLPRSRSITPPRRDTHRHDHQADSDRRSRDRARYDRHQPSHRYDRSRDTKIEKTSQRRSPDDRDQRVEASDSLRTQPLSSMVRDHQDNRLATSRLSATQPGSKSSLAEVLNSHHNNKSQNHKHSAGAHHTDDGSRGSPAARSPATPSIDDSSSSDTYDPEAPIVPISPGASPPISPATDTSTSKPPLHTTKNEKGGDDDVPCSAVQMNQHEKYLQKLNRQERVIEEVKVALRPFYQCRSITKEQYKDVLRRAVPKICHSKNGEINPVKIRGLVDAYVKKMKRQ